MNNENLFQIFSRVFIESQQSFNKCESELRNKCRVLSQKLTNSVDQIETDVFSANLNTIFDMEDEISYIIRLAQELENRRNLIQDSVDQLKKSTEKHVNRKR